MAKRRGIARRWMMNGVSVIILLLTLLCVFGALALRYFYYQQTQSFLYSRAGVLATEMSGLATDTAFDFEASSRNFVELFTDKEHMELQMLDSDGNVMMSSSGFVPLKNNETDYRIARVSAEGYGVWSGRNATGERVMSVSAMVTGKGDTVYGAVRCVTSLALVDRQLMALTGALVLGGVVLLLLVFTANAYFVRSIVEPVQEIGRAARRVALGDYGFRLYKQHDDELGDLTDTINYMAGEIRAAERLKNEFISSVSHELRTPLTAIKGWSETLREMPNDAELTEKGLRVIADESERLTGIVEQLLDFSGMQNQRLSMSPVKLDVQAELEDAVFLFRDRAAKEKIRLQFVSNEGLPPVWGDRDRLRQVFVNLLDNALKYSESGDKIRVEAAAMSNRVQVVISDTGRGIPKEVLPFVKQKFYKADQSRPGFGIGLALAEEIVRRHGGGLEIDSEEGVGTTVVVTLPVMEREREDYEER